MTNEPVAAPEPEKEPDPYDTRPVPDEQPEANVVPDEGEAQPSPYSEGVPTEDMEDNVVEEGTA